MYRNFWTISRYFFSDAFEPSANLWTFPSFHGFTKVFAAIQCQSKSCIWVELRIQWEAWMTSVSLKWAACEELLIVKSASGS